MSRSIATRSLVRSVITSLAIVAAVLLIEGGSRPSMWDADDGVLLEYALRYSPLQYFFLPAYTHGLSPANVTPWLAFAYDVDLSLFGLDPGAFYLVHLGWIAAVAVLAYFVMRLWLAPLDAAAGTLLFVLGATTDFAASHLMVAHYVAGMAFALLALLGYVRALRLHSAAALVGSVVAYALALTCKELYVPLPLVLLFLPERDWRTRLRYGSPHLALLALYALWRYAVLGHFLGGYQTTGWSYQDLANTARTFANLPNALLGHGVPFAAAALAVIVIAALALWRKRMNAAFALVLLAVVMLPLVPLGVLGAILAPDRFFFALWLVFACVLAWGASAVVRSVPLRVLVYAVVGVSAYQNLMEIRAATGPQSDLSRIYGFVLNGTAREALVIDKGQPYLNNQLNGLAFAYRTLAPNHDRARVLGRDELGDVAPDGSTSWFAWSQECRCVAPTTVAVQRAAVREYAAGGDRPPPAVDIWFDARNQTLRWKGGPYTDGTWTIRFESVPDLWTVKYDSWRPTGGANVFWPDVNRPFRFFVRFESPEGWAIRTPVLSFTPGNASHFSWAPPS